MKDFHLGSVELLKQSTQCAAVVEWGSRSRGAVPRPHVILQSRAVVTLRPMQDLPACPFLVGFPKASAFLASAASLPFCKSTFPAFSPGHVQGRLPSCSLPQKLTDDPSCGSYFPPGMI